MSERFFAYGTLQLPVVFEALTGLQREGVAVTLADHARFRMRHQVYPGMVEAPGSSVSGVLYEDVTEEVLGELDRFEGPAYERRRVPLVLPSGKAVEADAYLVRPDHRSEMTDEPWDLAVFRKENVVEFLERCTAFRESCGGEGGAAS